MLPLLHGSKRGWLLVAIVVVGHANSALPYWMAYLHRFANSASI